MPFNAIQLLSFLIKLLIVTNLLYIESCHCRLFKGVWSPATDPFKVIARFAVGKSDPHHKDDSYGYVFGNVTKHLDPHEKIRSKTNYAMLLVNRELYLKIKNIYDDYKSDNKVIDKSAKSQNNFCEPLFKVVDDKAYDQTCWPNNTLDVVRYVPCIEGGVCDGNFPSAQIVQNYQFTYVVEDQKEPTFWFLLLIACFRDFHAFRDTHSANNSNSSGNTDTSCMWKDGSTDNSVTKFNIWFVNGHPSSATNKPLDFDHQFSFEQQDLPLYLILIIFYIILTAAQLYAFSSQKIRNLLTYLFTISLSMHCLSFFFVGLHKIVFAHDGQGYEILNTVADIIRIISMALFILFVMIIAKGWPVTKPEISAKPLILMAWLLYIIIEIALFIWTKHSVNTIDEIDEYHTFPGWISLGFRVVLMMWFLYELRLSMMLEQDQRRLKFYLHFGAGILVWFVHLPLVAMVALQIELMWRYKLVSGFSSAADFLAYAIVTHLMWPTRPNLHFLTHQNEIDYTEELEYYDDSSITNSETYNFTNSNLRGNHKNGASNGYTYDNQLRCDIKT